MSRTPVSLALAAAVAAVTLVLPAGTAAAGYCVELNTNYLLPPDLVAELPFDRICPMAGIAE